MYGINELIEARGRITEHTENYVYLATVTLEEFKALRLLFGNSYHFLATKVVKFKDDEEDYLNIYIDPRNYSFNMVEFIVNMFDESIIDARSYDMVIEKTW